MSRSTISTFQLFEKFPNEASAYAYVEKRLWPNGPVCPRLNAGKVSRHTTERLDSFVLAVAGKRITYKKLTKGTTWFDADVQGETNATL